jgi:hypothetical protein
MKRKLTIAVLCLTPALLAQQQQQQDPEQSTSTYTPLSGVQRDPSPVVGGAAMGILQARFAFSQTFSNNAGVNSNGVRQDWLSREAISGNFSYDEKHGRSDFHARYSGGVLFSSTQRNSGTQYHNFDVSEYRQFKRFGVMIGDNFDYTPNTYTFAGGIPGLGGIGSQFGAGIPNLNLFGLQSGVILNGTVRMANASFVQGDWLASARGTVTSTFSYGISRFPDFSRFDSRQWVVSEGYNYRLTARTTVAAMYDHSHFQYDNMGLTTSIDMAAGSLSHQFSRSWSAQASAGPQFIQVAGSPTRNSVFAQASANYVKNRNSVHIYYNRRANSGSIGLAGAQTDIYGVGASRQMTRNWGVSAIAAYQHAGALAGQRGTVSNEQFGLQTNRRFGRYTGGYFSYTFRHQNTNLAVNQSAVLHGNTHTLGLGLTFSPRGIRIKRD